jgi:transcriptional regulator with XRE-family HTH domain
MQNLDYTKLKALRSERRLTQKEMSILLNTTQSNYNKLEKGLRKIDSIQTLQKISKALGMTQNRLVNILTRKESTDSAGMKDSELFKVEDILSHRPLREDEFIFFSAPILRINEFSYKKFYSGPNLMEVDEDSPFPIDVFTKPINIMVSDDIEISFENKKSGLCDIIVWLNNKKLGVISKNFTPLINNLINHLLISRIVLIDNDESIPGLFDTYMKVVFIATNAENKSSYSRNGRFRSLRLLSNKEIEDIESGTYFDNNKSQ